MTSLLSEEDIAAATASGRNAPVAPIQRAATAAAIFGPPHRNRVLAAQTTEMDQRPDVPAA